MMFVAAFGLADGSERWRATRDEDGSSSFGTPTKTGRRVYLTRLRHMGAGFSSSPVAADGRLYFASEDGDVSVHLRRRVAGSCADPGY